MRKIYAGRGPAKFPHLLTILFQALIVTCFLAIASSPTYAAEVKGRIRGTVIDPQGSVLPNITVTATNQETGVATDTHSNADGNYEFLTLPLGTYTVSAQAAGFQNFKASGIKLD